MTCILPEWFDSIVRLVSLERHFTSNQFRVTAAHVNSVLNIWSLLGWACVHLQGIRANWMSRKMMSFMCYSFHHHWVSTFCTIVSKTLLKLQYAVSSWMRATKWPSHSKCALQCTVAAMCTKCTWIHTRLHFHVLNNTYDPIFYSMFTTYTS